MKGANALPIYNAQILQIDAAETRRYAGLKRAQEFGESNILAACEEALLLLNVRGIWQIFDYGINCAAENRLPFVPTGKSIVRHLDGCERVICMAVTVGSEIEREVTAKFARGEFLASVLLDAAATAAVEQAADEMEKNFTAIFAREGFKLRRRFSPGYGDWNLSEQAKLFSACGAEKIGLRLTEAMMLEPRKSVTAIVGLERSGASKNFSSAKNCAACEKIDCPARIF